MTSTLKLGSKIPISEIDGDISEASGVSGFLDDDLTKLSQTGKEAVFKAICQGLNNNNYTVINKGGSMPFDGWCYIRLVHNANGSYGQIVATINDTPVGMADGGNKGNTDNSCTFIPVKKGDIYSYATQGASSSQFCRLFPLNQQEEA